MSSQDPALPTPAPGPGSRSLWGELFVLLGLTGFAISQPLLAVLGDSPTFFTFRDASPAAILAIVVSVAFIPPLLLWAVGRVVSIASRRVGAWVHLAIVAVLVLATMLQIEKALGLLAPVPQVAIGCVVAAAATWAYASFDVVYQWARFTAVLPLLALALFMVTSSGELIRPADSSTSTASGEAEVPSVVFLLLDELPTNSLLNDQGEIDSVRFPNIAALAGESTWYRNHTAQSSSTNQSVPSILSGQAPRAEQPLSTNYPDTLFTLLAPTHELQVIESHTDLCPPDVCPPVVGAEPPSFLAMLGDAFQIASDRIAPGDLPEPDLGEYAEELAEPGDDMIIAADIEALTTRPQRLDRFLENMGSSSSPTLSFLHLMLPHQPWFTYPNGEPYSWYSLDPHDPANAGGDWISALSEQRHLLQLQYADRLVGLMIDRLEELGVYDDSLVVVTADHGITFTSDNGHRTFTEASAADVSYAPLFVKEPGQTTGGVDPANTMGMDVLPIVADVVGVRIPWQVDGVLPGSAGMQERGTTKEFYDFGNPFAPSFQGTTTFDMSEVAPSTDDRRIGPITEDDDDIAGLLALLDVDDLLGRSLDDVLDADAPPVGADFWDVDRFRDPGTGDRMGLVLGYLHDPIADEGTVVLVEVNGSIVSAAALEDGRRFDTLLPQGLFEDAGNTVRLAVGRDDSYLPVAFD